MKMHSNPPILLALKTLIFWIHYVMMMRVRYIHFVWYPFHLNHDKLQSFEVCLFVGGGGGGGWGLENAAWCECSNETSFHSWIGKAIFNMWGIHAITWRGILEAYSGYQKPLCSSIVVNLCEKAHNETAEGKAILCTPYLTLYAAGTKMWRSKHRCERKAKRTEA